LTGTEVAVQEGQVPALRRDPARDLTLEDVSLQRLYLGQAISKAVVRGRVKFGDIFVADDKDDPNPTILATGDDAHGEDATGVTFHVLDLRKGKSRSIQGVLETWRYDDPNAPQDAWTTYTFFIAVPSYDEEAPLRYLLTKTARPTAQKINTVLARLPEGEPYYRTAFRLTCEHTQNEKGEYYVPRVTPVDASEESIAVAANLYRLLAASEPVIVKNSGEDPSF
jgi:hypothetical protein